jgi:hypothetical protein
MHRIFIVVGFVIWILTLGAIAGLVAGVVQLTKEMHTKGVKLENTNGQVLQVASSDFVPMPDGSLMLRDSATSLKIDIMKTSFNLTT